MEFNIQRLMLLVRRHLIIDQKKYIKGGLAGLLIVIAISLLEAGDGKLISTTYVNLSNIFFFVGGAFVTSSIFSELNRPDKGYQLITLPVSNAERLSAAWIITALIYPLVMLSGISLGAVILQGITSLANIPVEGDLYRFHRFDSLFLPYLLINSTLLAGAATFKRGALPKTALFFVALGFGIVFLAGIVAWLFSPGGVMVGPGYRVSSRTSLHIGPSQLEEHVGAIVYIGTVLLACFSLVIAFFKIRERQL